MWLPPLSPPAPPLNQTPPADKQRKQFITRETTTDQRKRFTVMEGDGSTEGRERETTSYSASQSQNNRCVQKLVGMSDV